MSLSLAETGSQPETSAVQPLGSQAYAYFIDKEFMLAIQIDPYWEGELPRKISYSIQKMSSLVCFINIIMVTLSSLRHERGTCHQEPLLPPQPLEKEMASGSLSCVCSAFNHVSFL